MKCISLGCPNCLYFIKLLKEIEARTDVLLREHPAQLRADGPEKYPGLPKEAFLPKFSHLSNAQ